MDIDLFLLGIILILLNIVLLTKHILGLLSVVLLGLLSVTLLRLLSVTLLRLLILLNMAWYRHWVLVRSNAVQVHKINLTYIDSCLWGVVFDEGLFTLSLIPISLR